MPAVPTLSWKPLAAIAASAVALLVVMALLLKPLVAFRGCFVAFSMRFLSSGQQGRRGR